MFAGVWIGGPRWGDDTKSSVDGETRSLALVPDSALKSEFEACKKWIEASDPSADEIEAWLNEREPVLHKAADRAPRTND